MTDHLITVSEARKRILEQIRPLPVVSLPLDQVLGCTLAEDIAAATDLPPFTFSTMDGFAVRSVDIATASSNNPVELSLVADLPAGIMPTRSVETGEAARIMTGAVLPPGADAVVPMENTNLNQPNSAFPVEKKVRVYSPVQSGAFLHTRGQDAGYGEVLISSGTVLKAAHFGLLASLGYAQLPVYRRPLAAIISTGNELIQPGFPITPGKIYDANSYLLASLVKQSNAFPIRLGSAPDSMEKIREKLEAAVESGADLILTSAGVSVGAFDYVRPLVLEQGTLDFWRVNLRPGKPFSFGSYRGKPIFCLPGNPISSFVTFLLFVMPALYQLAGRKNLEPILFTARLAVPIESDGRETYLRGKSWIENGQRFVKPLGHQGSGNLVGLSQSNALLIMPSGVKSLPSGSEVYIQMIDTQQE